MAKDPDQLDFSVLGLLKSSAEGRFAISAVVILVVATLAYLALTYK